MPAWDTPTPRQAKPLILPIFPQGKIAFWVRVGRGCSVALAYPEPRQAQAQKFRNGTSRSVEQVDKGDLSRARAIVKWAATRDPARFGLPGSD
jgi:hypothetical protein